MSRNSYLGGGTYIGMFKSGYHKVTPDDFTPDVNALKHNIQTLRQQMKENYHPATKRMLRSLEQELKTILER